MYTTRGLKPRIIRLAIAVTATMVAVPPISRAEDQAAEPALNGYCPAAYVLLGKAVKGDPAYQSTYRGRLYYLSSPEAKETFDADPEKYLPQFDGLCTTALGGPYANRLPSDPAVFAIHDGKLYLFSSERAKRAYKRWPKRYIVPAEERFAKPALDGYCPVSYRRSNRAVKGSDQYKYPYRGWVYHLSSAETLAEFDKDPGKYLPQYGGYCVVAVANNKRYPGDPTVFHVSEGKTYFFFDEKAKAEFMAEPTETLQKADANWIKLKNEK